MNFKPIFFAPTFLWRRSTITHIDTNNILHLKQYFTFYLFFIDLLKLNATRFESQMHSIDFIVIFIYILPFYFDLMFP